MLKHSRVSGQTPSADKSLLQRMGCSLLVEHIRSPSEGLNSAIKHLNTLNKYVHSFYVVTECEEQTWFLESSNWMISTSSSVITVSSSNDSSRDSDIFGDLAPHQVALNCSQWVPESFPPHCLMFSTLRLSLNQALLSHWSPFSSAFTVLSNAL